MSAPAPAPLGVVAHYNLLERLDPVGPGELYRARDTRLGRTVTLRLLPPAFTTEPEALVARARQMLSVSHPNVITLFDAGQHDDRIYLAFEFVKGPSLRAEMAGRPINVRRAVELTVQIADAVADAQAAGFVHGGLSPDSIVVTSRGHAKIPAFELTAPGGYEQHDGDVRLRDYDSPEEARGGEPDDRSDIYSVGAILYEMLTGRRPSHRGASAPSAANPHVPQEVDAVVLKAVAPNPELRYQSIVALAAALREATASLEVRDSSRDDAGPRRTTSVPGVVITAVAILLLAGVVVWWLTRS